jgi:hypothetical protein
MTEFGTDGSQKFSSGGGIAEEVAHFKGCSVTAAGFMDFYQFPVLEHDSCAQFRVTGA